MSVKFPDFRFLAILLIMIFLVTWSLFSLAPTWATEEPLPDLDYLSLGTVAFHPDDSTGWGTSPVTMRRAGLKSFNPEGLLCPAESPVCGRDPESPVDGTPSLLYCCPGNDSYPVFLARNVMLNRCGKMFDKEVSYNLGGCHPEGCGGDVLQKSSVRVLKKAFNLLHAYADNHYHTIIDVLPAVWRLRDLFKSHPDIPLLVSPHLGLDKILTLLQWKKGDLGEFVQISDSPVFAELVYSPHQKLCGRVGFEWKEIREHFFSVTIPTLTGTHPSLGSVKGLAILLIKRLGDNRRLENFEVLEERLVEKHGRERVRVFNGTENLEGTLEMFSSTTLLVAPHGAGLANMIFLPSNAAVLEIMPNEYQNPCYKRLAISIGLHYSNILGNGTWVTPITVELDQVVIKVNELAGSLSRG